MRKTKISTLLFIMLGVFAVAWPLFTLAERYGYFLPQVPMFVIVLLLGLSLFILYLGWQVRKLVDEEKSTWLTPVGAARVVVLAKASGLTGAFLTSWYGAQSLLGLTQAEIEAQLSRGLYAGAAFVASLVLIVCALVAEYWCRSNIDPEDPDAQPEPPHLAPEGQ